MTDPPPDQAFGEWLDYWRSIIQRISLYKWQGKEVNLVWDFLRRAVIVRQFEGLEALHALIQAGQGNFGVLFLRPAFEELVWVEYLKNHPDVANKLVLRLVHHEIGKSIVAQAQYGGAKEMIEEGGFTKRMIAGYIIADADGRREIREIGKRLGWKNGNKVLPSMSYLSEQVGRGGEYRFLYHGTSRYVHFSTQELLRRVWGVQGEVTISSSTFRDYWQRFGMSWGARIFIELLIACVDDFEDIIEEQLVHKLQQAQKLLQFFGGKIPIITADELRSWSQWESGDFP